MVIMIMHFVFKQYGYHDYAYFFFNNMVIMINMHFFFKQYVYHDYAYIFFSNMVFMIMQTLNRREPNLLWQVWILQFLPPIKLTPTI